MFYSIPSDENVHCCIMTFYLIFLIAYLVNRYKGKGARTSIIFTHNSFFREKKAN